MPRILLLLVQLLVIATGCSLQTSKAEANLIQECDGPACVVVARPAAWPEAQASGLKLKVANVLTLTIPESIEELTKVGDGILISWPSAQSLLLTDIYLADMVDSAPADLKIPAIMQSVFTQPADQLPGGNNTRLSAEHRHLIFSLKQAYLVEGQTPNHYQGGKLDIYRIDGAAGTDSQLVITHKDQDSSAVVMTLRGWSTTTIEQLIGSMQTI